MLYNITSWLDQEALKSNMPKYDPNAYFIEIHAEKGEPTQYDKEVLQKIGIAPSETITKFKVFHNFPKVPHEDNVVNAYGGGVVGFNFDHVEKYLTKLIGDYDFKDAYFHNCSVPREITVNIHNLEDKIKLIEILTTVQGKREDFEFVLI